MVYTNLSRLRMFMVCVIGFFGSSFIFILPWIGDIFSNELDLANSFPEHSVSGRT